MINRELKRNIWTELSGPKLFISPFVIILSLLIAYKVSGVSGVNSISFHLLAFILIFGGVKVASESVINEVNNRTWILQKMSGIGAFEMSIGKLFGSTIYIWYTSLFLIITYIATTLIGSKEEGTKLLTLIYLILLSISGYAMVITFSLLTVRRKRFTKNIKKTALFLISVLVIYTAAYMLFENSSGRTVSEIYWYGIKFTELGFGVFTIVVVSIFSVLALYRSMRLELQYKNTPIVWLIFLGFIFIYIFGLYFKNNIMDNEPLSLIYFLIVTILTYLSMLIESFNPAVIRKIIMTIKRKDKKELFTMLPLWIINISILIVLSFPFFHTRALRLLPFIILFYLLRDISVFYSINTSKIKRSSIFILLYLASIYGLLPSLLKQFDNGLEILFWPDIDRQSITLITASVQMLISFFILWRKRSVILKVE